MPKREQARLNRASDGERDSRGAANRAAGASLLAGLVLLAASASGQVYQVVAGDQTVLFHYPGPGGRIGDGDDVVSSDLGTIFSFDPNYVGSWSTFSAAVANAAPDPMLAAPHNINGFLHSGTFTVDATVKTMGGGPLVTGAEITATVLGVGQLDGQMTVLDGSYDPVTRVASLELYATAAGLSTVPVTMQGEAFVLDAPFISTGNSYVDGVLAPRAQALGATSFLFLDLARSDPGAGALRLVVFAVAGAAATADLEVAKTSDAGMLLHPGGMVDFTLTATNNGPGAATGVTVTDLLPAELAWVSDSCGAGPPDFGSRVDTLSWSVGTLANGASASCDVTVAVSVDAKSALENAAYALATSFDPAIGDNLIGETVEVEDDGPNGLRQDPDLLSGFPSDLHCDTCPGPRQRIAENFAVNFDGTHFAGIEFYGAYTDDTPFTDSFRIEIYESTVKTPGLPPTPGALLTTVTGPVFRLATGNSIGGLAEYEYRVPTSLTLDRGQYWLSVFNDSTASGGSGDWFWETADLDSQGRSVPGIVGTNSPPSDPAYLWNLNPSPNLALELIPSPPPMPNLFANPDFGQGQTSWDTSGGGSWSVDAIDGNELPGSYAPSLDCTATSPDVCTISQCVDVSALSHPADFLYGMAIDNPDASVGSVGYFVAESPNTDCGGFGVTLDFGSTFGFGQGWGSVDRSFTTTADARSVAVSLTISGSGALSTGVDDGYLLLGPSLFSDGFESGDTSSWSARVP